MIEKLNRILHCNEPVSIEATENGGVNGFGVFCSKCMDGAFHENRQTAIDNFCKKDGVVVKKEGEVKKVNNNRQLSISPKNMMGIFENKKKEIAIMASPVLTGDTTAMARFINNNIERYPDKLTGKAWDKIWQSPEGQQSIIKGLEDSLIDCVELGVTGDLVPMGNTCILIPAVESFVFVLTHGKNAPFVNVNIECIYEDDDYNSGRKNGSFFLNFNEFGKKRKKVIAVAVYGELSNSGIIEGEMYDAERLLAKAEEHSLPYKNYMKKIKAYEYQKSEGNVTIDPNGRESFPYHETAKSDDKYFDKTVAYFKQAESNNQLKSDSKGDYCTQMLPGKNGQWEKKTYRFEVEGGTSITNIFLDELENPYAGADQPELLIKTGGKSFLRKYKKVRNTGAAMEEVKSSKGAMKESLKMADSQFDDDIIDQ